MENIFIIITNVTGVNDYNLLKKLSQCCLACAFSSDVPVINSAYVHLGSDDLIPCECKIL